MATFDSWEAAVHPPEDYLMHFRTKGSKNGVRRYQREDGTWTELGLEERREREGWGDGESRKARKLQKKVERAERHQARKAARAQRKFERAEARRKRSLKGLTDEEMKAKLERAKMEAEYRDLTKKASLIETGAKMVTRILDYKDSKEQRVIDLNRQKIEMERLKTQRVQAQEATKQAYWNKKNGRMEARKARMQARQAKEERKKLEADVQGGLKIKRKAELKDAKARYKEAKRGWMSTLLKNMANKGKEERERAYNLQKQQNDLIEQRERRINAENVARANADKSRSDAESNRYQADQERAKAEQERYKSQTAVSERGWRKTEARTKYKYGPQNPEQNKKKKK